MVESLQCAWPTVVNCGPWVLLVKVIQNMGIQPEEGR